MDEMQRSLRWAILSALFLASCGPAVYNEPAKNAGRNVAGTVFRNPHRTCTSCHSTAQPKAGEALFAPGADPSSICLDCHQYEENHHPVDFVPSRPSNVPLPLFDGEIRCLTCHEVHGGPDRQGTSKLLRGGPYSDRRTICFKCHYLEQYSEINPHIMLDSDGKIRKIRGEPVCLICHSVKPDPEVDRTGDVRFKADVAFLCWRCHPPMPGTFFTEHFLVTPSPKTLQTMEEAEERLSVILPLVPRGRITCSTCHNPHQAGVIVREAAAKGTDSRSRLRLSSICFACHKM